MPSHGRHPRATALLIGVGLALAAAAPANAGIRSQLSKGCAGTPTIACYPLSSPTGPGKYDLTEVIDPVSNTVPDAIDPATTTGVTAARGGRTYYTGGWGDYVHRVGKRWQLGPDPVTGSQTMAETYGQVLVDRTGITDPATSYNPGLRDWRVRLRLQPELLRFGPGDFQLPDLCPDASCADLGHPSYNVVQKGRNGAGGPVGGFYKIEIMGYAGNDHGLPFTKGSVHCVFTDDDGTSVEAFTGRGSTPQLLNTKSYYSIDCSRIGSGVQLKVTNDTTGAHERVNGTMTLLGRIMPPATKGDGVLDTVAPANLVGSQYSPLLAVGKKPMSTNPADAFHGWIDYVSLSTQ